MPQIARYGWRRDRLDHRDYRYSIARRPTLATLPPSIDLRAGTPPVYDQGQVGSCTGNAIAGAVDYERKRQGEPFITPSRLAIYWGERQIEQTIASDAGAEIRDGIRVVASQGAGPEALHPYDPARLTVEPSGDYYTAALACRVKGYASVAGLSEMKAALANSDPVVFGFTVFEAFESEPVARTGFVPMPTATDQPIGGHAVLAVGYDDFRSAIMVRNSWGASWGIGGHFWLPYSYVGNPQLASDFWAITLTGYAAGPV